MAQQVVAFLEQLFETGFTWDEAELADLSGRLEALDGSPVAELAHGFAGLRLRLQMGDIAEPLRREVEAVIYPRLWKVLEAVRAGLPEGEQRARVHVLNRRLARLLASEAEVI
ncbi:MAG TPA: hypothetical protein VFW57_07410 [Acidimicrobiia bacterium]|nr:hypothetical protein [Acidimicrobiia bacterium]